MPNDSAHPDVAVFIDFENVYVSVRDKLDANPNFEAIMDRCEDFGRVVIARAYADWYRYPRVTSALYANSIEPIYVPTYYYDRDMGRTGRAIKNSVDMNLCIDAMKTLFTHTNIAKFVLATGDRDFIPLVNSIRQQGKEVIIIGIGGAASSHLAQSADEFIFYETLVGKKPVGDLHKDQPRAKMPEKGREMLEAEAEIQPGPTREPEPEPAAPPEVFDVLVQAIHLARERGYVCSFGSLKLLMKELMGGEFKENRYKDASGRPFAKFKDFVLEAERRGKVQVFTSGTVNEVFLPGEDPYKLSQFAQDLKEEPALPVLEVPAPETHAESRATSVNGRRRRRRTRGGQRSATPQTSDQERADEEAEPNLLDSPEEAALDELLIDDQLVSEKPFEERADETFDTLLERVEEALAEPALPEALAAEQSPELAPLPAEPAAPAEEVRPFEESEWELLREVVQRFDRPAPFNQIHTALREARNSAGIVRTNEELRTLIKQAINSGLLERSGKGNHIVYRLAPAAEPGETPDQVELIEAAETATSQPEFHTPEAAAESRLMEGQAALATAEDAAEPIVVPPTVITAEDSAVVETAPAPAQRSRSRRKPAAEPPAPVIEAPAQRSRSRRKPAAEPPAPVIEAPIPVAQAPAETAPAKGKRGRQKKATSSAEVAPVESSPAEAAPAKAKRSRRKKPDNAG